MGAFPPNVTDTTIVHIRKVDNPRGMKDLRSILCEMLYTRFYLKVLVIRMREVIDKCVSEEQFGFVPGRSIMDNALVLVEVLHFLKCKRKGKK